jgi:hypothetical protein
MPRIPMLRWPLRLSSYVSHGWEAALPHKAPGKGSYFEYGVEEFNSYFHWYGFQYASTNEPLWTSTKRRSHELAISSGNVVGPPHI